MAEERIVGLPSTRAITEDDGEGYIVQEGEIITEETVSRARAAGKYTLLAAAAGHSGEGRLPSATTGAEGEVAPSSQEMERVSTEVMEHQEESIIGLRSRRTITNEDAGGYIVMRGEPITEQAIEKAKAAGKLNELMEAAFDPTGIEPLREPK